MSKDNEKKFVVIAEYKINFVGFTCNIMALACEGDAKSDKVVVALGDVIVYEMSANDLMKTVAETAYNYAKFHNPNKDLEIIREMVSDILKD